MENITKKYVQGDLTIIWEPELCIHSGNCVRGLKQVFDTKKRPWITPESASTHEIVEQIKKCPSAALTYELSTKRSEAG